jgi:threonine aldolase
MPARVERRDPPLVIGGHTGSVPFGRPAAWRIIAPPDAGARPTMRIADFRSDTVTRPTPAMRRAMAEAEVDDDVLGHDPTVLRLEEAVAARFGREAALFVPSGTMGNQIAAHVHAPAGTEVVLEEASHCLNYEVGGLSRLTGLQTRPIPSERGQLDPEAVRARLRPATLHTPGTGLVIVENTHNFAGGAVVPLETVRAIRSVCLEAGVPLHMDGARLWHAAVATGVDVATWAAEVDSVMVCLSKGLGAPVGSMLVGDAAFIERARRIRKLFGGGMRQSGILAAAGLLALEDGFARLAEDHARCSRLARALAELDGIEVQLEPVETNILIFRVARMPAADFVTGMEAHGVWALAAGPDLVRVVTHRDVDDEDVAAAVAAARAVLEGDR